MSSKSYIVAVRVLCEFAAKCGDLDLRFTPSPTAEEGVAGHRVVAAGRNATFKSEVAVAGRHRDIVVRGRADGFDLQSSRVEEVKTFRGALDRMPANHRALHWAQAKVYGSMLCEQHGLPAIEVALVYFDVGRQEAAPALVERHSAADLRAYFETLCDRFAAWADRETAHRGARDLGLSALRFPHVAFRSGQRDLAEAVYRAARQKRCLLAQAPTGIGKTVATVFPALKASPLEAIDKVFFLTAKGTGRRIALEALRSLGAPSLRVLELSARDKACEHPDRACHGDSCPLARGFYDRLPAARDAAFEAAASVGAVPEAAAVGAAAVDAAAVESHVLDRASLRRVALAHDVCPYYLGQALLQWCDVVVGDYNHWFDGNASLHAATAANGWRVAVLVDEAHNLVERARAMYSASLHSSALDAILVTAASVLRRPLERLRRVWRRVQEAQLESYAVLEECPRPLSVALTEVVSSVGEALADEPASVDSALLRFHFELLRFVRLLETFGPHSLFDVTKEDVSTRARSGSSTLCVRNVVPASFLKPRFAAAHTTTLFSATLKPQVFYADTLGLPDDVVVIDVAAPFAAEQLSVQVVRSISTRFRDREASLVPIARLIASQYRTRAGNYLAFFSSFDYLDRAVDVFKMSHPQIPVWTQGRRMSDDERDAFLGRFAPDGRGIGFAVLGGAFGEGIDLVGSRLVGAFIATLGMPQVNRVNEEMQKRMDVLFGAGYDYTYLYPGLRRVTQAAGRVIRTLSDTGSVHLIDDRFGRPEVARLLPTWWRVEAAVATSGRRQ